jgi:hypothetical protein
MAKPLTKKPGDSFTVFGNAVTFGATIGLVEVATDENDPQALAGQLGDAKVAAYQAAVEARLNAADLVVAGEVLALHASETKGAPRLSEHDPEWWEATIAVKHVIKGDARTKTVKVQYPTSQDVMWRDSPALQARQASVFILQKGAIPSLPKTALTALDPLDVQGPEEQATLAMLLGETEREA